MHPVVKLRYCVLCEQRASDGSVGALLVWSIALLKEVASTFHIPTRE